MSVARNSAIAVAGFRIAYGAALAVAPERVTKLAVGESVRARFRLAVYAGQVSKARLDEDYARTQPR